MVFEFFLENALIQKKNPPKLFTGKPSLLKN